MTTSCGSGRARSCRNRVVLPRRQPSRRWIVMASREPTRVAVLRRRGSRPRRSRTPAGGRRPCPWGPPARRAGPGRLRPAARRRGGRPSWSCPCRGRRSGPSGARSRRCAAPRAGGSSTGAGTAGAAARVNALGIGRAPGRPDRSPPGPSARRASSGRGRGGRRPSAPGGRPGRHAVATSGLAAERGVPVVQRRQQCGVDAVQRVGQHQAHGTLAQRADGQRDGQQHALVRLTGDRTEALGHVHVGRHERAVLRPADRAARGAPRARPRRRRRPRTCHGCLRSSRSESADHERGGRSPRHDAARRAVDRRAVRAEHAAQEQVQAAAEVLLRARIAGRRQRR